MVGENETSETGNAHGGPMTDARRDGLDVIIGITFIAALAWLDHMLFAGEIYAGLMGISGAMAVVALLLRFRGQKLSDVGLRRPKRIWTTPFWFAGIFVATFAVLIPVQLTMAPLLPATDVERFAILQGNLPMLIAGLVSVWVTAAFFEEIIYRGFFLTRLRSVLGGNWRGGLLAALLMSVPFGLLHAYQGPLGMVNTGVVGLVFGIAFILNGRNLWTLIAVHGAIDTLSLIQFYSAAPAQAG